MLKPYYDEGGQTIYLGDALEVMPQLDPVDLVLTDPDYNSPSIMYPSEVAKLSPAKYRKFCREWFKLASQLTPNIVFTPGFYFWNYPPARWVVAWHKSSSPCKSPLGGFNVWEPILIYGPGPYRFGHDYLNYQPMNFIKEDWAVNHPCPKNPELWAVLVERASKIGNIILDPFMGSGTTLVAAQALGRKSIGIEIEEKYCKMAVERLRQRPLPLTDTMSHDIIKETQGGFFNGSPANRRDEAQNIPSK